MKKLSTNNEPSWAGYKLFEFVKNEFESLVDLLSCPRGFIAFKNPTLPIKSLLRLSTHRANINTTPIKVVRAYHQVSGDSAFERAMSCCERRANLQLSISL